MLSNTIHILIDIPPKYNVSEIVGYLAKVLLLYLIGIQTENISVGIEHFDAEDIM